MADKSGLLAVSHKIIGQPCVGGDPHGQVVKIGRRNSRRRRLLDPPLNLQRSVMRFISPIGQLSDRKNTGHVGHITGEIPAHIDHHAGSVGQRSTVSADRKRGVQTGPAEREIVRRRRIGIVPGQQTPHEDLHALPENPENTERPEPAAFALDLDRQFGVGHTGTVKRRNPLVKPGM